MQWLINFFGGLVDTLSSIFSFLISAITGLLDIISQLPTYIAFVLNMAGQLPTVFLGFFTAGVTISVVFLIVGRGEGGD